MVLNDLCTRYRDTTGERFVVKITPAKLETQEGELMSGHIC